MNLEINLNFLSIKRTISITKQWVQFGIAMAVILASTTISFWGSPKIFIILLALFGGLVVMLALMGQINLGFILIFLSGMFIPIRGPGEFNATTGVVALMLGLWIMEMFIVRRHFEFVRSRTMLPIIIFLVISTLAFFIGQIPWFVFARQAPLDAQLGGYAIVVLSLGGTLLSAHLIKNIQWLKYVVWVFVGLSSLYVLGRAIHFSPIERVYFYGFTSQSMFWTWLVALVFGQIMYNDEVTRRIKGLLVLLLLLILFVAIVQGYEWKSGWVPPLIAVVALLGIRYRKLVVFAIPFMVAGALFIAIKLIGSDEYSWGTRIDAWRIVLEISRISPFFGTGFANYYWYTPLFPIRGYSVTFNSHSQFIDLIAQTGFLGLFGFLWVFFELGRLSWKLTRQLPNGFPRAYAYGILGGIIATPIAAFLGDWVLPFVYNVGLTGFRASILPWIFMGGVMSLEQMLLKPQTRRKATSPSKKLM